MNLGGRLIYLQILLVCFYGPFVMLFEGWGKHLYLATDVVTVLLLLMLSAHHGGSVSRQVANLRGMAALFVTFAIMTFVINRQDALTFIWGMRGICRFGVMFAAAVTFLGKRDIGRLVRLFDKILYINLAVSVTLLYTLGLRWDSNSGTFTSNGGLVLLCIICIPSTLSRFGKGEIGCRRLVVNMMCIAALAIISELKFLFYIIPLNVVMAMGLGELRKKIIPVAVAVGLMCGLGMMTLDTLYGEKYTSTIYDTSRLESYVMSEGGYNFKKDGINRGTVFSSVGKHIFRDDDIGRYCGFGIGSASASSFIGSDIYKKFGYRLAYNYFLMSYLLIELGWIGLALYMMPHAYLLRCSTVAGNESHIKQLNMMMLANVMITMFYNASLITETAYLIYIVLAFPFILQKIYEKERYKSECDRAGLQHGAVSGQMS